MGYAMRTQDGDDVADAKSWLERKLAGVLAELDQAKAERDALKQHITAQEQLEQELRRREDEAAKDLPRIPRQRHARARTSVPPDQRWLKAVQGFAPIAGLSAALRHFLAASVPVKAAALASVGALSIAGAAVVAPHGPVASVLGVGTPATPNPVAGIYSASPITGPSSPLKLAAITGAITKPRLDADGLAGQVPPSLAAPYLYAPSQPSPSSPSYQQPVSSQQSQQGGSVQIAVSTTAPDLSSGAGSVTVTLTASGDGGWAAWKVDATDPNTGAAQTDLDFSPSHGVLRPGQEAQVVVTLDASLDEAAQETFEIAGQQVTIALPGPPPAPAVAPSPVDTSLPVVVPTPDPSAS